MNIKQVPSPNYFIGRNGYKPEAIVIHVMDGTLAGTDNWFAYTGSGVSTHYGIGISGEVHQYVKEENGAWGNGRVRNSNWPGIKAGVNPNYYTISIEHEGNANSVWSQEMKEASAELIRDVAQRWQIPLDRDHVIGHYQIDSIGKPNCPATNKKIIDEILDLAKKESNESSKEEIKKQIISLLERL